MSVVVRILWAQLVILVVALTLPSLVLLVLLVLLVRIVLGRNAPPPDPNRVQGGVTLSFRRARR